jgi:ribosomal protein L32E
MNHSIISPLDVCDFYCRKYAAEIAHNVSSVKRKAIVDRAAEVRPAFELELYNCQ